MNQAAAAAALAAVASELESHCGCLGSYIGVIYGIMENEMETTIVYWGYIGDYMGIMEKKMETITMGFIGLFSKLWAPVIGHSGCSDSEALCVQAGSYHRCVESLDSTSQDR